MDYNESEEFICIASEWSDGAYLAFFDDCLSHFLEMTFEDREEIRYLKNSYEFKKWFSVYFSKRNQFIVEEVIKWDYLQNCWVFKEQMESHVATYKARNSAAFRMYYSYLIKDYSTVDFDKEHYLRLQKTAEIKVVEEQTLLVAHEAKQEKTQSIFTWIFAQLMSFII
ncbi:hypothetical protein WAF17_20965 [Bernardetia sp. ABR2-2B]|uniref:hypothetical protein n=1 Tax=Bernardetia sp. ABR2-2B TaxID=3127472 RepID=UPI0030D087DC